MIIRTNLFPILVGISSTWNNVCRAAFLPSMGANLGGSTNSGFITQTGTKPTTTVLNLDNLPKLSDMEINMPDMSDNKLLATLSKPITPTPPPPLTPSPPIPFDPTNPEALISITKSFIATDFGIQSSQLPSYSTAPKRSGGIDERSSSASSSLAAATTAAALPFYSSSLLSSDSFVWISGNNINDGRTGLLTKEEYLAAGRYFDLRKSFPDLEYRAHDFRVIYDEAKEYSTSEKQNDDGEIGTSESSSATTPLGRLEGGEITVRFTTMTTGTFRGAPLSLRSMTLEPNGKVMKCPPTSISITYSTQGQDRGKITKLVTDMVLDRQVGNTQGLTGVPGAAVVGGAPPNEIGTVPPLVALGRLFGRPTKPIDNTKKMGVGDSYVAPFPDSVLIQLAKGVLASNFGLNDPNLLADGFSYVEPLMGPMEKEKYLQVFSEEYDVSGGVPDLDYGLQNFRVDAYDPYRVWVDCRAKGTRTGDIGKRVFPPNANSAIYEAPPEAISFTFDDDGFCTRLTAAAVMDPLLGNTGGLGGVYGLLYSSGTPESALKTRSLNGFLSRASKSLLSGVTGLGADGWKLSDGRVVNGLPTTSAGISLPSVSSSSPTNEIAPPKLPQAPAKPFFAVEPTEQKQQQRPTIALPKATATSPKSTLSATTMTKPPSPPATKTPPTLTKTFQIKEASQKEVEKKATPISSSTADSVTEALNSAYSAFGITNPGVKEVATPTNTVPGAPSTSIKAQQLRNAAAAARAEAAEAKKKSEAKKAQEMAEKQAMLEAAAEAKKKAAAEKAQVAAEKQEALDAKLEKQRQVKEQQQAVKEEAAASKRKEQETRMVEVAKKKEVAQQQKNVKQQTPKVASPATKSSSGGDMFSFFASSSATPSKKSPSSAKSPSSSEPAKRSPTINLFDSLKKPTTAPAAVGPKKKQVIKKTPAVVAKGTASSSPVKRSPTISLFGTSSAPKKSVKQQPTKKATTAQPRKKSPTLNIFGIGGAPKQSPSGSKKKSAASVSAKSRSQVNLKQASTKKKSSESSSTKGAAVTKNRPTFNLFGGGTGPAGQKKPAASSSVVTSTQPVKKSSSSGSNPFSGFFGGNSVSADKSKSNDVSSSSKTTQSKPNTKKAVPKEEPVKESSSSGSNPFSGFFGGNSVSADKSKSNAVSSSSKTTQRKPNTKKAVPKEEPVKESSSSGSNPFSGFFGGNSVSADKSKSNAISSSSKTTQRKPNTKKARVVPKGVPVLKQWKQVKDNAVEGRIFGSTSFKDGAIITTSSISRGKFSEGTVVQTKSGSKYFLE